ncbi:ester cyclase [Mucilaginibacter sp.]|uniref:ester cyclase n=1 Tax=Mucilaginibacter sp. TaxID=1882438 RepID=UPI0025EA2CE2|nr:ester cyclase [Mucilaginibacter sp.]
MQTLSEKNKTVVIRFNKEFIEADNLDTFSELVAVDMINHAAIPGTSSGPDGMLQSIRGSLKKGFPDLEVEIVELIAEKDLVTAQKIFRGTHQGTFMGIPATGKKIQISSLEIIRIKNGQYVERWGISDISEIIKQLIA